MSKMLIRVLFGQPRESYMGQCAPELICATDEWTMEANPDYWDILKKKSLENNYADNFISMSEFDVEVDQDEIRRLLLDSRKVAGIVKSSDITGDKL